MSRGLPLLAERALLPTLGVVAVYAALVPLGPGSGLVPPDLLYCLVVAWVIRRPASAPLWVVLGLGLLADLLLSRLNGLPFPVEWLAASAGFAAMLAAMNLALVLTLAHPPGLAASAQYLLATALAYPLVVAGLLLLHVRAPRATRTAPLRGLR
jgi:rod shape-determining protein MreD